MRPQPLPTGQSLSYAVDLDSFAVGRKNRPLRMILFVFRQTVSVGHDIGMMSAGKGTSLPDLSTLTASPSRPKRKPNGRCLNMVSGQNARKASTVNCKHEHNSYHGIL